MERLTEKLKDILNEQDFCFEPGEIKVVEKALGRLAAYEDTGLEPEEIKAIAGLASENCAKTADAIDKLLQDDAELKSYRELGPIDRLQELAQADREGRCVVLPCKVEDDVYINILGRTLPFTVISISQMASTPTFKAQHGIRLVYIFKADDVGETVFMTRAEAEAALRREQDGNNK